MPEVCECCLPAFCCRPRPIFLDLTTNATMSPAITLLVLAYVIVFTVNFIKNNVDQVTDGSMSLTTGGA